MRANNNKYFSFGGKKYVLNLEKLKEVCITPTSDEGGNNELEISQAYEADENGELRISSKVEHETRSFGSTQNDVIVYDFVKLLIISLLEYNGTDDVEDLGTMVTINTLLYWGILEIID